MRAHDEILAEYWRSQTAMVNLLVAMSKANPLLAPFLTTRAERAIEKVEQRGCCLVITANFSR